MQNYHGWEQYHIGCDIIYLHHIIYHMTTYNISYTTYTCMSGVERPWT